MSEALATAVTEPLYHVSLDVFEGPLDLLLHLIKENKLDIYNIPISKITDQYLSYIDMMESLDLDLAGEFLLMASTLAHIKSQLLLPPDESQNDPEDEGKDPRTELVRRLLEYQKYKNAAEMLFSRPLLHRDVFKREREDRTILRAEGPTELVEISVFKLVEAFHRVLKDFHVDEPHQVERDSVSVGECVSDIAEVIRRSEEGSVRFKDIFPAETSRRRVITTFLALLEMLKRGLIGTFQAAPFSEIEIMGTPLLYGEWTYDGTDEYSSAPTQIDS